MSKSMLNFPARTNLRLLLWLVASLGLVGNALGSSPLNGMILRIRRGDGSMERIHVPSGAEETMTLQQALEHFEDDDKATIQVGSSIVEDGSQTLSALGLKHGSLITIVPPKEQSKTPATSRFTMNSSESSRFVPFPDLAKDYETALRRKALRKSTQHGMSYGDLANLQSSLHIVEPQPEGPIKRVYMCRISAERFQSNCRTSSSKKGGASSSSELQNRVGLLLGSIHRERVDTKPVKARTSLSSIPSDREYCNVVKVHALWEPLQSSKGYYDMTNLLAFDQDPTVKRVLQIASSLGLSPVGWIFSYTDPRLEKEDSLPMWGADVFYGARLQIANMQYSSTSEEGAKFVTMAMDAKTGATEAFQLSDVSVQMVAEELLDDTEKGRFVKTQHAVLVDGKETTQLDSVLCLVNTAMLSHKGSYAGETINTVRKNGSLTPKTKKALLAAIEKDESDCCSLLNALCDFNVLVALDQVISSDDSEELCRLVQKWARGQKRGTVVGTRLKLLLQSLLGN